MHPFRRLTVWRKAHELTLRVYAATEPCEARDWALVRQIRRAAASIPANIVEGSGRDSAAQFGHFLEVAHGSVRELEYHLMLAADLRYFDRPTYAVLEARTDEVARMILGLRRRVTAGMPARRGRQARRDSGAA